MKLTSKTVAGLALPVGKTDHIVWDDEVSGLGYRIRLGAGGKLLRSWVAQYKRAGATRRVTLGQGGLIGAEQARLAARKLLAQVVLGSDPQAERSSRRSKDRQRFHAVVEQYLAARADEMRPRSMVETKRYLTDPRYYGPLHRMPVDTVHRSDVAARNLTIARECGAPTAMRAHAALSSLLTWSMKMGFTDSNPCINAAKPEAPKARTRVLTDPELASIWHACGNNDHGKIVQLLILGAWRRAECGDMAWSELDDPERPAVFTVPASRSKSGRAHALPLTPTMARIITSVPRMATRDQLFGHRSHGFTCWHKAKVELDQRSGVSNWTVHDIRRSTASKLGDLGVQPHIIECILNHTGGFRSGVSGTYNRSPYEREVKAALVMWDDRVRVLTEGGERKVLPLEGHRRPS